MFVLVKVHAYPPHHCAGGEMMLHAMLRALVDRGHKVHLHLSRINKNSKPYVLDGVKVFPVNSRADWAGDVWACDVMVTHNENTFPMASIASRFKKPLAQVIHSVVPITPSWLSAKCDLAVFNSESMRDEVGHQPNPHIIVRPPVMAEDYRTTPGHAVTLINLSADKGEKVFWEMARRMPEVDFLGVKGGYGTQVVHDLPNVEIVPHGRRMRDTYAATKILLVPSRHESWGRVATEAMVSGIPVIASPTPGLKENLGAAGTFVEHDDWDGWEREIRRLLKPQAWGKASKAALKRAQELDPTDDLNRWADAVEALGDRRPLAVD